MKKSNALALSLAIIGLSLFAIAMDNETEEPKKNYEYLAQELENAKSYTIEVIEGMPEEDFTFKPGTEMRTFGAQAFHIAYSLEWFTAQMKGSPIQWAPGDEDRMSKDELIEYATKQLDEFIELVKNTEENGAFTARIIATLRHNSHHRGQMVAYYRANDNMTPPSYK